MDYDSLFGRHQRIALQVSGGQDSLALLHLLLPWKEHFCVYWLNPGNPFPEMVAMMDEIRAAVPRFKEVAGRQPEVIALDGWPSDVVPIKWTRAGQYALGERPFMVQGRLDCCWRSLMVPMHEAMIADGITCVIRGKRSEEADKSPSRDGDVIDGIEFVYPLWDWSADDVISYLAEHSIPRPTSYRYASHSLDCMDCTAWWGEGMGEFLAAEYPEQHAEYARRIGLIKSAVAEEMNGV